MNLIIRADASTTIGAGHVMRCLAIAHAWQTNVGIGVTFACAEISDEIRNRLQADNIQIAEISHPIGSIHDAQTLVRLSQEKVAQAIVVDGYQFGEDYLDVVVRPPGHSPFSLVVDDDSKLSYYATDFVLNPNPNVTPLDYPKCNGNTRLLLGQEYALLRREFLEANEDTRLVETSRPLRILVTMGGSDPDNTTRKVVEALLQLRSLSFNARVILGGMNPYEAELSQLIADHSNIEIRQNVINMVPEYRWADFAVAAGGGSNWEMSLLGVPRILVVIADNQVATARACADASVAVNLGPISCLSVDQLASAIKELASDKCRRAAMHDRSKLMVDGKGAQRVVTQLAMLRANADIAASNTFHFRSATLDDAQLLLDWRNDPSTAAASRGTDVVELPDHLRWLRTSLASPQRRLLIAELEGEPVGTVRIDVGEPCELSWTVAPGARRRGIGKRMVTCISNAITLPTKAVARKTNVASQKVALSAGFRLVKDDGEWMTFLLEPNLN